MLVITRYYSTDVKFLLPFQLPMYIIMMVLVAYFVRKVLTQFFVLEMDAQKTTDSLSQILDNLPDAVLMLEPSNSLSYCNQQADCFFGVSLSQQKDLSNCQYLLMDNRCFYELKNADQDKVDSACNETITVSELGQSVLTLREVVQTFDVDSPMFNIKLREQDGGRTVIMKKN